MTNNTDTQPYTQAQPSAPIGGGHNPYANAAGAYKQTQVNTISGMDVVVELYKGMIKNVEAAKAAYENNKLDEMCRWNEKTFNILVGLQTHLDFDQGKDAAEFLNGFYNTIFGALAKVHREEDPAKGFDDIIGAIEPVYMRWVEFAKADKSPADKAATDEKPEIPGGSFSTSG